MSRKEIYVISTDFAAGQVKDVVQTRYGPGITDNSKATTGSHVLVYHQKIDSWEGSFQTLVIISEDVIFLLPHS